MIMKLPPTTLYRNALMISLDNRSCDYPVLSIHGAPKTVYQTHMKVAKFSRRILDEYGKLVGTYSNNPMLNNLMYDVDFTDGATKPPYL